MVSEVQKPTPSKTAPLSQNVVKILPQGSLNINSIGIMVDRWSDLIEGEAKLASKVQESVIQLLKERDMPEIVVKPMTGNTGSIRSFFNRVLSPVRFLVSNFKPELSSSFQTYEERPVIIASTAPGISAAIFIREHGKDLYISWRTHVQGVWNWNLMLVLFLLAILPFVCGLCLTLSFRGLANDFISTNFGSLINQNQQQQQVYGPLGTAPPQQNADVLAAISNWVQVIGGLIGGIVIVFIAEMFFLVLLGYIVHASALYYLFVEPTVLDAEDAIALSISVDKTLRQAVSIAGLEVGKLSPHTISQSGRRKERMS